MGKLHGTKAQQAVGPKGAGPPGASLSLPGTHFTACRGAWKGLSKEGSRKDFALGVQGFILCPGLIWGSLTKWLGAHGCLLWK